MGNVFAMESTVIIPKKIHFAGVSIVNHCGREGELIYMLPSGEGKRGRCCVGNRLLPIRVT